MSDNRLPPLQLALVLHNHQPVGNLPEVFASAYDNAYAPMLGLVEQWPALRWVLHYTGPLLEWLAEARPGFLERLRRLQQSGRVEILGGGLYEPILPVIPDADKLGQLHALSDWLEQNFGQRPTGAWLAERVWEPQLPAYMAKAGIQYTIVDEEHFARAGYEGIDNGSRLTEDQGCLLRLFPAATELRYLIPWRSVTETIAYLRSQWQAGKRLLVFADDGEKFGSWPGTFQHCYTNSWLPNLLTAISESGDWLQTTTLNAYVGAYHPDGRIYLASASYHEMEDWSLPPQQTKAIQSEREQAQQTGRQRAASFMRLGHWRNFLAKYPEANYLLQRSRMVSTETHNLPDSPCKQQALRHLWRSQCNCPYWHGVFGGIYMYHIRHENWRQLISAENLAVPFAPQELHTETGDYDADGLDEARLSSRQQSIFIHSSLGQLYEWDLRQKPLNLLNTLAHYREAATLADGESAPAAPLRHAFLDYFLSAPPSAAALSSGQEPMNPGRLRRRMLPAPQVINGIAKAAYQADYELFTEAEPVLISLNKEYSFCAAENALHVRYRIRSSSPINQPIWFASEINLAPPPGFHQFGSINGRSPMATWQDEAVEIISFSSGTPAFSLHVQCNQPTAAVSLPLLSHHRSELGWEEVYQGSRLLLACPLPESNDLGLELTLTWD